MELTNRFTVGVPVAEAWAVLTDVERIAPCLPGAQLQEVEGEEYRGIVKVKVGPITAQYKGKAVFLDKDDTEHVAVLKAEGRDTRGQGNASATITATLTPSGEGTAVTVVTDLTITGKVAQFGRGVLVDVSGKLLTQFVECLENDLLSGADATPDATDATDTGGSEAPGAGAGGTAGGTETAAEEPAWAPAAAAPAAAEAVLDTADGPVPSSHGSPAVNANGSTGSTTATSGTTTTGGTTVTGGTATTSTVPPKSDEPQVRKIEHEAAAPVDLLDAAGVPVAKRAIPVVGGILVILWFLRRRRSRR